jgi:hypothetical protein
MKWFTPEEKRQMNTDFQEWLAFSDEVFNMFYREVGQEMEEYGYT